jgi:hypothetical protein
LLHAGLKTDTETGRVQFLYTPAGAGGFLGTIEAAGRVDQAEANENAPAQIVETCHLSSSILEAD